MLPGEADTAVDLDVLRGDAEERLGGVRLGQRGEHRDLRGALGHRPGGVVHRRAGGFQLQQQVGAAVLDGLEAPDRPVELVPLPGVAQRHVQRRLRTAQLLGGQRDRGDVQRGGQGDRVRLDPPRRGAGELQPGQRAGLVQRGQWGAGEAGRAGVHGVEVGAGGHHDEVRDVAVRDVVLVSIEDGAGAGEGAAAGCPGAVVLGVREGGDRPAAGDAGQQVLAGLLVAAVQDRVGGQHGAGQVRPAEQRAAQLLQHDRLLHEGEPGAAVLFGDGQRRQAELARRLLPHRRVVARFGVHHRAYGRQRGLLRQEPAYRLPQLPLLSALGELHPHSLPR